MDDEGAPQGGSEDELQRAWRELDSELGLSDMLPSDDEADAAVQTQLVGLLASYLKAQGLMPNEGKPLEIGPDFVAKHAGPLVLHVMNGVISSITNVATKEIGDAEGAETPHLELDFAGLFGALLQAAESEESETHSPSGEEP